MTPEEREEIQGWIKAEGERVEKAIHAAIERVLLKLPDTAISMVNERMARTFTEEEFFKDHSDLKEHRDLVMAAAGKIEGENPGKRFKEILEAAIPEARKMIETKKGLSMGKPESKPDLQLKEFKPMSTLPDHGAL